MSAASSCDCPCVTPEIVSVPGSPGENGTDGAAGAAGHNAFTALTAILTIPAVGFGFIASVGDSSFFAIGQNIFVSDGTHQGNFEVAAVPTSTSVDLTFLGYPGDSAPGQNINVGGRVTPAGLLTPLAAPLPNSITDNSGGTASDTIVAETAQFTLSIPFRAAAITGNVLLYTYTPAFAFKIIRISASVVDAITTGGRAATLTTAIGGTPTTGGVVVMSGAYALGAQQASSAAITGANTGTNVQPITITASAVTAFAEGGFIVHMQIENLDTADAVKSLSTHINDLITSLT